MELLFVTLSRLGREGSDSSYGAKKGGDCSYSISTMKIRLVVHAFYCAERMVPQILDLFGEGKDASVESRYAILTARVSNSGSFVMTEIF